MAPGPTSSLTDLAPSIATDHWVHLLSRGTISGRTDFALEAVASAADGAACCANTASTTPMIKTMVPMVHRIEI
jgi:hypothetical protein